MTRFFRFPNELSFITFLYLDRLITIGLVLTLDMAVIKHYVGPKFQKLLLPLLSYALLVFQRDDPQQNGVKLLTPVSILTQV